MKVIKENKVLVENQQEIAGELNDYLHDWFSQFGFDLDFELGTDFQYQFVDDKIYYAFVIPDAHDRMFFDVCREIAPELEQCDNFLLSLFHEVGHYITQNDFEDEVWDDYDAKADWGNDYNGYYHHPIEYEATRAGIELLLDNADKIPDLLRNIQKYEKEILEKLGYEL